MSQERLNGLTILCIGKNMLENIDVDSIINILHLEMLEDNVFYQHLYA